MPRLPLFYDFLEQTYFFCLIEERHHLFSSVFAAIAHWPERQASCVLFPMSVLVWVFPEVDPDFQGFSAGSLFGR